MRKIIVILIAMTQIVLLSSCDPTDESDSPIISQSIEVSPAKTTDETINVTQSSELNLSTNDYVSNLSYIDEKINGVVSDEKYQNGDLNDRALLIESILEQLLDEGCITNYHFELDAERPYASYDYAGGGSGVAVLKDFPQDQN